MDRPSPQPKTETRPDDAELVILAVLAEEPLYGYAIAKKVAARSDGDLRLTPGLLYPLLAKLERSGLLAAEWEEVRSERREAKDEDAGEACGRRRKWYKLSPKGRRRLEQRIGAHHAYTKLMARFVALREGERE